VLLGAAMGGGPVSEEFAEREFAEKYGPWAFVAGASMGIGAALSHEAAARGLNVVMVARGAEQLEAKAIEVRERHGVEVRTVAADLADVAVVDTVASVTDDIDVGLVVYNATVAPAGRFTDVPLDVHLLSVAVNCATPVALCHHFAPRLTARGKGGLALVSSMGGTQGAVNFSTYNAGKAFDWILAESLWAELGEQGVDVTTIFVGPTASPNYLAFQATLNAELCNRPDTDDPLDRARSRLMAPDSPEHVATSLYDQLGDGPVCYPTPDDAWISATCFAMSRRDAVGVWTELQHTSTHVPEKQAR